MKKNEFTNRITEIDKKIGILKNKVSNLNITPVTSDSKKKVKISERKLLKRLRMSYKRITFDR